MLVQKLEVDDLQSMKGYFDAVMVYAQNKVRQEGVVQIFLKLGLTLLYIAQYHVWLVI